MKEEKGNPEEKKEQTDSAEEDLVFEEDTLEHSGAFGWNKNPQETIKKLREKLKKCESEKQESMTGLQRTKADFINLPKRDEKEKEEFAKFAVENFVKEITPILDSFDLAIAKATEAGDSQWKDGVTSIQNQLLAVLQTNGMGKIVPLNEPFDPKFHEAVGTIETEDESKDHLVLEVLQAGYTLHGKVVRPAKVRIGQKT